LVLVACGVTVKERFFYFGFREIEVDKELGRAYFMVLHSAYGLRVLDWDVMENFNGPSRLLRIIYVIYVKK